MTSPQNWPPHKPGVPQQPGPGGVPPYGAPGSPPQGPPYGGQYAQPVAPGPYPPPPAYGTPFGQPVYQQGPGYPARPRTSQRGKNGVVLGVVAAVIFVLVTTVTDVVVWAIECASDSYPDWVCIASAFLLAVAVFAVGAVAVFAVDTRIRSRTPAALTAAVAVAVAAVNALLTTVAVVTKGEGTSADILASDGWAYARSFLTAGFPVCAWVLARRTSPVAIIAGVVAGGLVDLVVYVIREVLDPWITDFWPMVEFVYFTVPVVLVSVCACWLAVAIDKALTGSRPPTTNYIA